MIFLTIKQLKKRVVRGLIEPELFYTPAKERYEPMVIKVSVVKANSSMTIGLAHNTFSAISIGTNTYKYLDMEQEYKETGSVAESLNVINSSYKSYNIGLFPYYNLKIKDSSKILITDDINYFRNSNYDCLFKKCDNEITDIMYSKCTTAQPIQCVIDWGDGTIDNCENIIEHIERDAYCYDRINKKNSTRMHCYTKTGEYYITIKGRIPCIYFQGNYNYNGISFTNPIDDPNIRLLEVIKWGNLGLYNIDYIFELFYNSLYIEGKRCSFKFKMPKHIPSYSFKNVLSANRAFVYLDMNENEFSHEIIFDFVKTFPNLLSANYMFGETKISYIPQYFCNNHKNIIDCDNMFYNCPITRIESFAFANCSNLSRVSYLTYSSQQPLITIVEDSIFENDINLVDVFAAFNYVKSEYINSTYRNDEIGLKTVGNNIYKNCKRLRHANEPFYQQAGLVTVGEGLFEGCDDLINVNMCFFKCFSLQNIGKDIFKGCSKVRNFSSFLYECYLANLPDNMLYDLKYHDYLKEKIMTETFNGYWKTIEEENGVIQIFGNEETRDISHFFNYKGFNHENFPTRKHSNDIFSKAFVQESIENNSFLNITLFGNLIFESLITFRNKISNTYWEYISISNFTGKAFPVWEYPLFLQSLSDYSELFGFRNIKVKRTYYKKTDTGGYEESGGEYDVTINYYDNYIDIATADPFYYEEHDGCKNYWCKNKLLHTYYYPDEYEIETEKQEVLEFNDPVEERKYGT